MSFINKHAVLRTVGIGIASVGLLTASLLGSMPAKASAIIPADARPVEQCTYQHCVLRNAEDADFCMDIWKAQTGSMVPVQIYHCNESVPQLNQRFVFGKAAELGTTDAYRIHPAHTYDPTAKYPNIGFKCIDIDHALLGENILAWQYTCYPAGQYKPHQQFLAKRFNISSTSGTFIEYKLVSRHTYNAGNPMCLAPHKELDLQAGLPIVQKECSLTANGPAHHRWILTNAGR